MRYFISTVYITILLLSGCSQKSPTVQTYENTLSTSEKIGGLTGGVLLGASGAIIGGAMGLLVSGGTNGVAPLIGIVAGTLAGTLGGASLGLSIGKAIE